VKILDVAFGRLAEKNGFAPKVSDTACQLAIGTSRTSIADSPSPG